MKKSFYVFMVSLFCIFGNFIHSSAAEEDTVAPIITLNGAAYLVVEKGTPWIDTGASANDNVDGNVNVETTGSVDTNTVGDYVITYHAQDTVGNSSSIERMVKVVNSYDEKVSYTFEKKTDFIGSLRDEINSVTQTRDNGYVVVGATASNDGFVSDGNSGRIDAFIQKYDAYNQIIWQRTFGGSGNDLFESIIESSDGGLIAVGYTASNDGDITDGNYGSIDALIVKFTSNGVVEWQRTFGGDMGDSFSDVVEMNNGDIIAVGTAWSDNFDIYDGYFGLGDGLIVRFDSLGNDTFQKTFGGSMI